MSTRVTSPLGGLLYLIVCLSCSILSVCRDYAEQYEYRVTSPAVDCCGLDLCVCLFISLFAVTTPEQYEYP
ncbi:hypothetical protein RRG08_006898 [Elysia crispata]|uniref:Uncharacterized protein n=1 Tax=Elysia crispata TaxID=231223 RepID=A0AAE1AM91_9GAST|nr:hypothetical protein RRG08_006898 [Elysia crispata]